MDGAIVAAPHNELAGDGDALCKAEEHGEAGLKPGHGCRSVASSTSIVTSGNRDMMSGHAARGILLRDFHTRMATAVLPRASAKALGPPCFSMIWEAFMVKSVTARHVNRQAKCRTPLRYFL